MSRAKLDCMRTALHEHSDENNGVANHKKDLSKYAYNQFKGHFLGFIVGTSAASIVSTFFKARIRTCGVSPPERRLSVATRSAFWSGFVHLSSGSCIRNREQSGERRTHAQVERITSFIHERGLMSELEASAPRTAKSIKLIARSRRYTSKTRKWVGRRCAEGKPSLRI